MIVPTVKDLEGNPEKLNKYACAWAIFASIIPIISGYDIGVMSGAMLFMQEDLVIDDVKMQILLAILNVFAFFGSVVAGWTSNKIGRRHTISLSCAILSVGSILMGYGPNYGVLLAGRCAAGLGVGYALAVCPVYSAEISSADSRGLLIVPQLNISIGILLGYVSNLAFKGLPLHLGWRFMLGIGSIPSIALALGSLAMPESPRWLVMHNRLPEAHRVLSMVCNTEDEANLRLRDIKLAAGILDEHGNNANIDVVAENKGGKGVWKELILRPTPAVRWMLVVALGIHFFTNATGIEALLLYSVIIFKKAGVSTEANLLRATIGIGLTKLIFTLVATFNLDKIGRRKLLLTSTGGVIVSLFMVGFCLTIVANFKDQRIWAMGLCMASVYLFVAFFSIGLGPITWVYSSEIFPLRLRAQGMSLGVAVNRLMNAIISYSFISIYQAITIGGTFFLFAGISVLGWFFFYFFLPETKGRTLEEMELLFTRSKKGKNGIGNGTGNVDV